MHANHEREDNKRSERGKRVAHPETNTVVPAWPQSPKSWEPQIQQLLRDQLREWREEAEPIATEVQRGIPADVVVCGRSPGPGDLLLEDGHRLLAK